MIYNRDNANKIIEDYEAEYADEYTVNRGSFRRLLRLCDLTDKLSSEFSVCSVQILALPEDIHATLCFHTDELIFGQGRSHPFFDCIKDADFLGFSKAEDGMLKVSFGICDLWVAA